MAWLKVNASIGSLIYLDSVFYAATENIDLPDLKEHFKLEGDKKGLGKSFLL